MSDHCQIYFIFIKCIILHFTHKFPFFTSFLQDFQKCFVEIQAIKFMTGCMRFSFFGENDQTQIYPISVIEINAKGASIKCKQTKRGESVVSLVGRSHGHRVSINFRFWNRPEQQAHTQMLRTFLKDLERHRKTANKVMEYDYMMANGYQSMDDSIGAYQLHYMQYEQEVMNECRKASQRTELTFPTFPKNNRWSISKIIKRIFK